MSEKKVDDFSDNTIPAEGLRSFFKSLGKKRLNGSKKIARNVLKNPGRALDITANTVTQRQLLEILQMYCQHYLN